MATQWRVLEGQWKWMWHSRPLLKQWGWMELTGMVNWPSSWVTWGQEGWRLGLVRLTAGDLAPAVFAVCVVSEARPRRGRVFKMMAMAVDGVVRGQGLATEAMARMKAELLVLAGPRFEPRADLASCMKKGRAGFYESQGWMGGGGM